MATGIIIAGLAMFFDHKKQVMRNQERMAAIEKGIALPDLAKGTSTRAATATRSTAASSSCSSGSASPSRSMSPWT